MPAATYSQNLDHPWVRGKEIVFIKGSFAPNGSSQPDTSAFLGGHIATVLRNSAGNWTVTLKDKIKVIEAEIPGLRFVTASTDLKVQFGAFSNVGTATAVSFIMRSLAVATETDIAANADNRISFFLVARKSVLK